MDTRQRSPNYNDYSTLEVADNQHPDHAQSPPPQTQPDYAQHGYASGGYPPQAYQTDTMKYSPQPYEGHNLPQAVDPSYPEVAPKESGLQVVSGAAKGDYAPYGDHHGQTQTLPPQERRIWGLKRKTFFILLIVGVLLVIGAVVGGVVGGVVRRDKATTDTGTGGGNGGGSGGGGGGSSPGPSINSPILGASKISAINWTDSNQVEYNAVFWQAKTNHLMMSQWDSKSKSWGVTNVTGNMVTSTSVEAKPGTPLAAAVRGFPYTSSKNKNIKGDFGIALFYLLPSDNIMEIYTADPKATSWELGRLITTQANIQAGPGSQLAVTWSLCETNCSGTLTLFYEGTNQQLMVANSSDWRRSTPLLPHIPAGASLAVARCAPGQGGLGNENYATRVYYDSSNFLSELMFDGPPNYRWVYGQFSFDPRLELPLASNDGPIN